MAGKFRLAHVGINSENSEEAKKIADLLCLVFDLKIRETDKAYFAGDEFECMKYMGAGRLGHIAMEVEDIRDAIAELKKKGFDVDMDTAMYREDGSLRLVYIKEDFAGFSIHLSEKNPDPVTVK